MNREPETLVRVRLAFSGGSILDWLEMMADGKLKEERLTVRHVETHSAVMRRVIAGRGGAVPSWVVRGRENAMVPISTGRKMTLSFRVDAGLR